MGLSGQWAVGTPLITVASLHHHAPHQSEQSCDARTAGGRRPTGTMATPPRVAAVVLLVAALLAALAGAARGAYTHNPLDPSL